MQDYNTIIGSIRCVWRMDARPGRYGPLQDSSRYIKSDHEPIPCQRNPNRGTRMMAPKKVENLFYPQKKSAEERCPTSRFPVLL